MHSSLQTRRTMDVYRNSSKKHFVSSETLMSSIKAYFNLGWSGLVSDLVILRMLVVMIRMDSKLDHS